MKKLTILVAAFVSVNATASGTIDLQGTVIKESGEGIEGARISLKNNPSVVSFSDESGVFTLPEKSEVAYNRIRSGNADITIYFPKQRSGFLLKTSSLHSTIRIDVFRTIKEAIDHFDDIESKEDWYMSEAKQIGLFSYNFRIDDIIFRAKTNYSSKLCNNLVT